MEVKRTLTTIVCDEELKEEVARFLDCHQLLSKGKIYAHKAGDEIHLLPEENKEIFEITGPGGSDYKGGTGRWHRFEIEGTKYFVALYNQKFGE